MKQTIKGELNAEHTKCPLATKHPKWKKNNKTSHPKSFIAWDLKGF